MTMVTIATTVAAVGDPRSQSLAGYSLKPSNKSPVICHPLSFSLGPACRRRAGVSGSRGQLMVQNAYRDGRQPSNASIFTGGFVLGGIVVGTIACVYAPQISKALTGTDKKDLMKRLPKFIYDEEKALEKTRKILTEKIAQLNSAIDDVSSQLREDDEPNGVAVASDEVEAAI